MQHISTDFLLDDITIEDEIDELFSQLGQYEPPADMVERIMAASAKLPRPKPLSQWKDFDLLFPDTGEMGIC